jgi:hypothetical protein
MKWTLFKGVKDTNKIDREGSWADLVGDVRTAGAVDFKLDMAMIKLAEFGDDRAGGQSLRNTDNIGRFYGIEADYDEGKVSMQEAFDRLNSAGIRCLLHTSAQHTPEKPRWRVLAPFYEPDGETLEVRTTCLNRLNGVLGGILAPESWTPAQCYFIGSLSGQAAQEVLETDDMCGYIDAMAHLDDIAIGAGSRIRQTTVGQRARVAPVPPGTRLAEGDGRREMLKSYGGALRADGADADAIFEAFKEFADMHFDPEGIDWDNLRALAVWCGGKSTREEMLVAEFEGVVGVTAPQLPKKAKRSRVDWSDYVFVAQENRVMRLSTGGMSTVPAFNAAMMGQDRRVPAANNKTKEVSAITYLMDYKKVPPVFLRMYMPSVGKFFEHGGEPCVNSYQPELVPEADKDWMFSGAWRIVEEHLHTLFEDPKDGDLILDWMAHNVQFPGRKILWAPIIKGTQGDGKSTIRNILTLVMGHQNVRDITHSDLTSSFNAYAEGACVAALEEIRVVGHSRFDVMNALKPLITNEIISVTRKGQDSIQVPNTQNYIGFTNSDDALPIDANDRRYGIFYTKYETREQLWADRSEAYWERLHSAYRDDVGAIRGWLLDRDLSGFNRLFPPAMNTSKQRMIDQSRPVDDQMIVEAIEDLEDFFTGKDVVREVRAGGGHVHVKRVGKVATEMGFTSHRIRVEEGERERIWVSADVTQKNHDPAMLRHLVQTTRVKKAGAVFE